VGDLALVRDLAYLLHASQRLPLTTPGVSGGVTFLIGPGDSGVSRGFESSADELILTTVESVDLGCGKRTQNCRNQGIFSQF